MLNINIILDGDIREFQVNDMEDLVSQITNNLKDIDGKPLSEDAKLNATWMAWKLEKDGIELKNNMDLELKYIVKNNNMVKNNNLMSRLRNFVTGNNNQSTSFILEYKSEQDECASKLTQASASFARTTTHLAKRSRYYQW